MKIESFVRKPYDVVSRDQALARAQIQEDEDSRILEAMDDLFNDPPCETCSAPRTSEGADAGCAHCVVRDVMIR